MNEDLGIKYFYNRNLVEERNVDIKQHPSDFIVQEVADDKLCGFDFIIDLEKLFNSIDFLYCASNSDGLVVDDVKNKYPLRELFRVENINSNQEKNEFMNYLLKNLSTDDLKIGNHNLLEFINCKAIVEIKSKWNTIKEKEIRLCCGEGNKEMRTRIYRTLNRIPFIKSKTVDGQIVVENNSEGIFRAVVCKVMCNSMDISSRICRSLDLKNGKVGFAGNKDKKAVTFQEISIDANFECIFELAYEYYDDRIIDILKKRYKDPLNKFFRRNMQYSCDNIESVCEKLDKKHDIISLETFNLVNLSNYLIIKYISDKQIDRDSFLEIKNKIEAILETVPECDTILETVPECDAILETVPECDINGREYCKSQIHIFDIKRADIKRLGDLKGNKFTIKLNGVREINKNTKFLNYFGAQRFGKCKNNHKIGEKILNREYEEAVEMIMKNSKGYEAYKSSESENKIKKITTVCDSTEKYIFMMKLKGKTDKNIVFGLKREIRMLYLHAYQSYLYNESINKEIEKNRQLYESGITNDVFEDHEVANVGVDSSLILPLEKMNDKMLKGGSRKAVAECIALEGKSYETHFEVSFFLGTSSYATMALRELLGKNKLNL